MQNQLLIALLLALIGTKVYAYPCRDMHNPTMEAFYAHREAIQKSIIATIEVTGLKPRQLVYVELSKADPLSLAVAPLMRQWKRHGTVVFPQQIISYPHTTTEQKLNLAYDFLESFLAAQDVFPKIPQDRSVKLTAQELTDEYLSDKLFDVAAFSAKSRKATMAKLQSAIRVLGATEDLVVLRAYLDSGFFKPSVSSDVIYNVKTGKFIQFLDFFYKDMPYGI